MWKCWDKFKMRPAYAYAMLRMTGLPTVWRTPPAYNLASSKPELVKEMVADYARYERENSLVPVPEG